MGRSGLGQEALPRFPVLVPRCVPYPRVATLMNMGKTVASQ